MFIFQKVSADTSIYIYPKLNLSIQTERRAVEENHIQQ